jgi:hypothetical protein
VPPPPKFSPQKKELLELQLKLKRENDENRLRKERENNDNRLRKERENNDNRLGKERENIAIRFAKQLSLRTLELEAEQKSEDNRLEKQLSLRTLELEAEQKALEMQLEIEKVKATPSRAAGPVQQQCFEVESYLQRRTITPAGTNQKRPVQWAPTVAKKQA